MRDWHSVGTDSPDLIGAGAGAGAGGVGVVMAGVAAWKAGQATKQSNAIADRALTVNEKLAAIKAQGLAASQAVAAIEGSLRHAERMPRFTAELALWGTGSTDFRLNVWLDSTEAVSRMRVVVPSWSRQSLTGQGHRRHRKAAAPGPGWPQQPGGVPS